MVQLSPSRHFISARSLRSRASRIRGRLSWSSFQEAISVCTVYLPTSLIQMPLAVITLAQIKYSWTLGGTSPLVQKCFTRTRLRRSVLIGVGAPGTFTVSVALCILVANAPHPASRPQQITHQNNQLRFAKAVSPLQYAECQSIIGQWHNKPLGFLVDRITDNRSFP